MALVILGLGMFREPFPNHITETRLIFHGCHKAGLCLLVIVFFIPETYEPIILVKKARKLRKDTGDVRYYAALEKQYLSFAARVKNIVAKPFIVLFRETMLMAITVYMAVSIVVRL